MPRGGRAAEHGGMDSSDAVGRLRVSDAERDAVVRRLQDAYAEGRLDHDEFDMRAHLAMTAKTRDDLTAFADKDVGPTWDGVIDTFICDAIGHVAGAAPARDLDNVALQAAPLPAPGGKPK